MAAAAVVGAMGGGAVLGDDHISGGHVDCSDVSWDCFDECLELKMCVAIPESGGIDDCPAERSAFAACEAGSGGGPGGGSGGGGGVVIVPACPGGQHYHAGGGCHGDHECGDDEIGGGSEECEPCGEGQVPNEDGTACVPCDWGESLFVPGQCQCGAESLDAFARQNMGNIPDEPWETAGTFVCPGSPAWGSTKISTEHKTDKCRLDNPANWTVGKAAVAHSHPVFAWDRDKGRMCMGERLKNLEDVLEANGKGLGHSGADMNYAKLYDITSYLSDSARNLLVYRKNIDGTWEETPVP